MYHSSELEFIKRVFDFNRFTWNVNESWKLYASLLITGYRSEHRTKFCTFQHEILGHYRFSFITERPFYDEHYAWFHFIPWRCSAQFHFFYFIFHLELIYSYYSVILEEFSMNHLCLRNTKEFINLMNLLLIQIVFFFTFSGFSCIL